MANTHKPKQALRILLVEDQDPVRRTVRLMLESRGHQVCEAANVEEAHALFREHAATLSMVLTDVALEHGSSGIALGAEFQKARPELPVVYMSGFDMALGTLDLRQGYNFLQKPFRANELFALLELRFGG